MHDPQPIPPHEQLLDQLVALLHAEDPEVTGQ
jgi:hypothetical protein